MSRRIGPKPGGVGILLVIALLAALSEPGAVGGRSTDSASASFEEPAAAVVLGGNAVSRGVAELLEAPDVACVEDADCVVVMAACCHCSFVAVNRARAVQIRARIEEALSCSEVCSISCAAPIVECSGSDGCRLVDPPSSTTHQSLLHASQEEEGAWPR